MQTDLRTSAYPIIGFAAFGAMLFWPAGTFNYWQAWLFIGAWSRQFSPASRWQARY